MLSKQPSLCRRSARALQSLIRIAPRSPCCSESPVAAYLPRNGQSVGPHCARAQRTSVSCARRQTERSAIAHCKPYRQTFSPTLTHPSSSPGDFECRPGQDAGPQPGQPRTKNLLLQAVGASSVSSLRTTTPHGGGGELGVGGSARCAGAYDRTRVRTRVNARAWQGLRLRFNAPSPSSRRT